MAQMNTRSIMIEEIIEYTRWSYSSPYSGCLPKHSAGLYRTTPKSIRYRYRYSSRHLVKTEEKRRRTTRGPLERERALTQEGPPQGGMQIGDEISTTSTSTSTLTCSRLFTTRILKRTTTSVIVAMNENLMRMSLVASRSRQYCASSL